MMSRRSIKRIALVLLMMVGVAATLGYDYIFDQNLPPSPYYGTLDWKN